MERAIQEVTEIGESNDGVEAISELSDLQRAFVGGGSADPIYH